MRKLLLILGFLIVAFYLFSDAILQFETTEYDFGKIKEEAGPYEYIFKFTNTGDHPLKLSKVKAGCGCTVASWSTGIIPPKGRGFVKVIFDSNNRPGKFEKKVTIYSNDIKKPIVLHLKGNVIGTPGKFYPKNTIGDLQFDKSYINITRIKENEKRTVIVNLYNKGNKPLSLQIESKPEFLHIKIDKKTLKPKEKAKMYVTCNSAKIKKFGMIREPIKFILNGKREKKSFYIRLYRYKDFSVLSEHQKKNAPHIRLINRKISFSYYKHNKSKYDTIRFKNVGKSPLTIYNINTSDKIKIISFTKSVTAGKIGKIVFEIKNKKNINNFRGFLKIYSNDPSNFETTLTISGSVNFNSQKAKKKRYAYISVKDFWNYKNKLNEYLPCKRILEKNKNMKIVILDVRSKDLFEKNHFKNSLNIPFETQELENSLDKLDRTKTIYFIVGENFEQSDTASILMSKTGFEYIFCLKGNYLDFTKFKQER